VLDDGIKALALQLGEVAAVGPVLAALTPTLAGIAIGMVAGAVVLALVMLWERLRGS
jgi:predicted DNA repair protein MutK